MAESHYAKNEGLFSGGSGGGHPIGEDHEDQDLYGPISPGRGKWSKCGIFNFFWSYAVTKRFDFFNFSQLFPLHSKNVFVLVLTHLESELELFEVDDICDDGDDDL